MGLFILTAKRNTTEIHGGRTGLGVDTTYAIK